MKRWLVLALLLTLLMMMTACGGADAPADAPEETTGEAPESSGEEAPPAEAGEKRLVVGIQSDGKTLDPHVATDAASMRLIENMYSTLLRYQDGTYGEIEPDLAEAYTISDDGLVYTFTLKEASFHDGTPVTAEDVKYSFERLIDLEVRANQFAAVEAIEATDEKTVVITLSEPQAPFLTNLANPMNAIVNKKVAESEGLDFADGGSGPFQLVEWQKDQRLELEKFDGYFEVGLPKLDALVYRPIPDDAARVIALKNGEVDLLIDIQQKDAEQLTGDERITVETIPGTFWEYVGINVEQPPLDDVRVRQAIAHAIDRQEVNDFVKFGRATVLDGGVLPETHWAYADLHTYDEQDIDKAKELLAEAGYPNGVSLEMKVGSEFQYQVDAAQIIKQQLAEAGIDVNVVAQESGIFFDALGQHDFQLTIVGWLGFVDPDEYFYNIFHTGEDWNQQGYSNERVDALLDEGRLVTDLEERKAIYNEIEAILVEEAPMAFLYMNEAIFAYRDRVQGFKPDPMLTTLSLRQTTVE